MGDGGDADDDDGCDVGGDDGLQQDDDYDKWPFPHSSRFRIAPLRLLDSGDEDGGGWDYLEC